MTGIRSQDRHGFERHAVHNLLVFGLAFAVFLMLCPTLDSFLNSADQCHPIGFIENIRAGEIVYKDFVLHFPPGIYYLAYGVMQVFNNNFMAYIALICLGNALVSFLVFKIACELNGIFLGYVSLVLSTLLHPPLYKWYLCAFPLLCIYLHIKYLEKTFTDKSRLSLLVASATVAGLGAYFRLDTAAYAVAAVISGQLALAYLSHRHSDSWPDNERNEVLISIIRDTLLFLASFGLTLLPFCILGIKYDFLTSVWESLFVLTATMPGAMGLPYPGFATIVDGLVHFKIHLLLFYIIPVTSLAYLVCAFTRIYRIHGDERLPAPVRWVPQAVFGSLLLLQVAHRSDFPHLLQVATPFWIIFPAMISSCFTMHRVACSVAWVLVLIVILLGVIFKDLTTRTAIFCGMTSKFESYMMGPASLPDHPVSQVVRYVQENSNKDHRILVLSHSVQIYYFAHRKFSGGLVDYIPWKKLLYDKVMRKLQQQKSTIDLVIFRKDFCFDGLQERSLNVFAPEIRAFVETNFCCALRVGTYEIFKPRIGIQRCRETPDCSL